MAKREVIWTNTASIQLRRILEFWVDHNKSNAYSVKLLGHVEKNLYSVSTHPERSPQSIFPDTRVAAMNHYSIYYKITDQQIVVTAFWDNRQDPIKLYRLLNEKHF